MLDERAQSVALSRWVWSCKRILEIGEKASEFSMIMTVTVDTV